MGKFEDGAIYLPRTDLNACPFIRFGERNCPLYFIDSDSSIFSTTESRDKLIDIPRIVSTTTQQYAMVGMLPGVECARRRRLHQSNGGCMATHNSTRRSFSLYSPSNNMESLLSSSSLQPRSILNQAYPDDKLGGAAREAKQRLDDKFRAHQKSDNNQRHNHNQKRKSLFHGLCLQLRS